MTHLKVLALPLVLLLTACSHPAPREPEPSLNWPMPAAQLGDHRGLPQATEPCRRRGCDNHKLFFNPAKPEPDATTLHRGW